MSLRVQKYPIIKLTRLLAVACMLVITAVSNVSAQDSDPQGEITIDAKPGNKNAIFDDGGNISYNLGLKSTYDVRQDGTVTCELLTDDWKKVWTGNKSVKMGKKGSESVHFSIPKQEAGVYRVHFSINLSYYDDTVKRVVLVSPEKIKTEEHTPADFNDFWNKSREQLNKIAPQYRVTEVSRVNNGMTRVYKVEMTSWDNVKIYGWLTVPVEGRKHPVIYKVPGYNVAMKPETDKPDFAVFALDVRGNGMSRQTVAPIADRFSITNIENKDRYIYHGVYMDCLRGMDFIMSHEDLGLDTKKIAVLGGSQGATLAVFVAAIDQRVTACTFELPLYADMRDAYAIGTSFPKVTWPINRFVDYLKQHSSFTSKKFFDVWDYYDPQNFASRIKCPVLMGIGLLDEYCPPRCSLGLYNKLTTEKKEFKVAPDKAHEMNFNYFMDQLLWLKESLRVPN